MASNDKISRRKFIDLGVKGSAGIAYLVNQSYLAPQQQKRFMEPVITIVHYK